MTDVLLTVPQVAAITNLHPDTIRRAIRDGQLHAIRLRGRIRIPHTSYEQWLLTDPGWQAPANPSAIRAPRLPDRPRSVSLRRP